MLCGVRSEIMVVLCNGGGRCRRLGFRPRVMMVVCWGFVMRFCCETEVIPVKEGVKFMRTRIFHGWFGGLRLTEEYEGFVVFGEVKSWCISVGQWIVENIEEEENELDGKESNEESWKWWNNFLKLVVVFSFFFF